ncbi:carboxypeptidase-like regulatory domain-containing protein [Hymenobacter canadensis]|uniref:Carboxypeptidase-like regulatory domain-containing protein n=1 Tax=Hymenobacter canadensis TaxID=2999067 RepID=A0ABY7LM48_9BACT|nr:carboxypeptidase-like regulatory domain-containing protein [Hymenobacter canadensis]WBA41525.1 carboxypeptidase-like regulatory domain-containing protein [Hymenobacter canadensis]
MNKIPTRAVLWLITVLCLLGLPAFAQSNSATLVGSSDTDKNEALAGTTIVVVHVPTGVRRTVVSDGIGAFTLADLLPGGPYTIYITQLGYKSQLLTNMFLKGGQTTQLPVRMTESATAQEERRSTGSSRKKQIGFIKG